MVGDLGAHILWVQQMCVQTLIIIPLLNGFHFYNVTGLLPHQFQFLLHLSIPSYCECSNLTLKTKCKSSLDWHIITFDYVAIHITPLHVWRSTWLSIIVISSSPCYWWGVNENESKKWLLRPVNLRILELSNLRLVKSRLCYSLLLTNLILKECMKLVLKN